MKRFLALLAALLLLFGILGTGSAASPDFTIKNGILLQYNGRGGNVVVPEGVVEIGRAAFACAALDSISFPSTLKTIHTDAFVDLRGKMKTVTIPASVEKVAGGAFRDSKLNAIKVASGNKYYKSVDGVLLTKDGKSLVSYPCGKKAAAYTIPNTVETIRLYSLAGAPFTSLVIPASVKTIENDAFFYNTKLKSLTIPATVKTVFLSAFDGCTALSKLEIKSCATRVVDPYYEIKVPKLKIYAPADHPVRDMAKKHKIPFKAISGEEGGKDPSGEDAPAVISVELEKHKITLTRTAKHKKPTVKLKYTISPKAEFDQYNIEWQWYGEIIDVDPSVAMDYITIKGLKAGTSQVYCFSPFNGSLLDSCEVTVVDLMATGLSLDRETASLTRTAGKKKPTLQLKAAVEPADALNGELKWSTSDKKIATVDKNGRVTAKKPGTVTITCKTTDGAFTASCEVTVKDKAVKSISPEKKKVTLKKGKTLELKIKKIKPADALNQKLTWTSSDEKVATVDKNGKVKAVGKGTCTITVAAKDNENVKAEIKVTVK